MEVIGLEAKPSGPDLWQVRKIIEVALSAALEPTDAKVSNLGQCHV